MKFKRELFFLMLVTGVFFLTSYGFAHEGEHHDDKGRARGDHILFDEGSGSSAIREYEKRHNKPHRVDQYMEESSGDQHGIPASSTPRFEKEGGQGPTDYDRHKENYKDCMEEGSRGR